MRQVTRSQLRRGLLLILLGASALIGAVAIYRFALTNDGGSGRPAGTDAVPASNAPGMTAQDAIDRATITARAWAPDAILFAVVGVERAPSLPTPTPRPPSTKPEPPDRFPCGRMDANTWAIMEPTWAGEPDKALGDGRMVAWSVVYYSTSKDMGMAVIVRPGHDNVCIADPLTANDRVELRSVTSTEWTTDSTEAIAAIRAKDATIDRALSQSRDAQVAYGIDLRRSNIWGIKGQVPDQGVTFSAEVSLTNLAVTKMNVSGP